jgi:hypothetical protein
MVHWLDRPPPFLPLKRSPPQYILYFKCIVTSDNFIYILPPYRLFNLVSIYDLQNFMYVMEHIYTTEFTIVENFKITLH